MGTIVTFFFSGFVLGKVPFGLSPRFRPMLQRGVDLAALDVSYFTGLSYYILLLFSSQGPFSLAFADGTVDQAAIMRQQMGMGMAPGGGAFARGGLWVGSARAARLLLARAPPPLPDTPTPTPRLTWPPLSPAAPRL